ncbi:MAG TPA: ABC transporter permease [Fimbriimonadaceae bacterium]|nr:ABC transporter permease [Fimbriimonadaceae bacterium]
MLAELKELWKFRELLLSMVERELRIRYKNSFLGFFWSLLNPLVTVLVMTVVFKFILRNQTPSFSAYVLAAYLPYMFFQLSLMDSAQSVLGALPIVKKVYFPREVLPISVIISNFVHFLLALGVFFVFQLVIWLRHPAVPPFQWSVVYLPLLLIINLALSLGLGLLISALNTFYEDVKYIVGVALYLLFFLSPIMYFSENVAYTAAQTNNSALYALYHLNPVAMLSTAYRKVMVAPQPVHIDKDTVVAPLALDWGMLGVTALFSIFILWFGYHTFNRMKWKFVERP